MARRNQLDHQEEMKNKDDPHCVLRHSFYALFQETPLLINILDILL
jgi:hypothetical protein